MLRRVLKRGPMQELQVFTAAEAEFYAKNEVTGLILFRIAGRRYALPMDSVRGFGRLPSGVWLTGFLVHGSGRHRVQDLKHLMGLPGQAGSAYMMVDSGQAITTWAVDGIEGVKEVQTRVLEPYRPLGRLGKIGLICGKLMPDRILLLNPRQLFVTVRRAALRV